MSCRLSDSVPGWEARWPREPGAGGGLLDGGVEVVVGEDRGLDREVDGFRG